MQDNATIVSISWHKRKRGHRILFGMPQRMIRLDWQRRLAVFYPGDVFAYERWQGNKYGTQDWRIFIVQAAPPEMCISQIDGIKPGAILLLSAIGKHHAKRALAAINALSQVRSLGTINAAFWLQVSSQLQAGLPIEQLIERAPQK